MICYYEQWFFIIVISFWRQIVCSNLVWLQQVNNIQIILVEFLTFANTNVCTIGYRQALILVLLFIMEHDQYAIRAHLKDLPLVQTQALQFLGVDSLPISHQTWSTIGYM